MRVSSLVDTSWLRESKSVWVAAASASALTSSTSVSISPSLVANVTSTEVSGSSSLGT